MPHDPTPFLEPAAATAAGRTHVFVTVGSTRFDALVQRVLSAPVLDALHARGYRTMDVQCGNSSVDHERAALRTVGEDRWELPGPMSVNVWRFKPSLEDDYERAGLIISHAGSGTILDVLRRRKPLLVIPNPTLLDNHQAELSDSLAALGHLESSTVGDLPHAIEKFDPSTLIPFPQFDGSRFREILDEEMGFSHSRENSARH